MACSTFTICAILAIRTRSAWRAKMLRMEIPDEAAIDLELAEIVIGRHVAAAIPAFVTNAEKADLIRKRMTVRSALLGEGSRLSGGHVLQPFRGFARSPGANVNGDVGLRIDLVEEVHEFMCSKGIRLDHPAPVGIERYHPLWADAAAPVVFISEAPARPAHVRHLDFSKRRNHVVADPPGIRECGTRTYPYTVRDAAAEMDGEPPKNTGAYGQPQLPQS